MFKGLDPPASRCEALRTRVHGSGVFVPHPEFPLEKDQRFNQKNCLLKRAIGLECNIIMVRTIGLLSQISPFLSRKMSRHYDFDFIEHHFQLGDGIFRIRWNTQAMIFVYHKLMSGS